jgi:signal transduction histidine kinase/CHASE2 domain-containing sensor protein
MQNDPPNPEMENARSLWRWLRLNLVLLLLTGLVGLSFPVASVSRRLGDSYFRIRGIQPTSKNVALVVIDDAALAKYGRWPWPRERLAQVVRAVSRQHPKAIGIDILLSEKEDPGNDQALQAAIQQAGNVVLPAKISGSPENSLWTDPLPEFVKVAAATGHAQAALDLDGVCRRIPLSEPSADGPRPAFAVAIATLAQPGSTRMWTKGETTGPGVDRFEPSYLTIDYRQQFSSAETVPPFITLSARDLLEGSSSSVLEGKIVLLGFGATELSDRLFTPVSVQAPMPGVEVNANAVNTIVEGRPIKNVGMFVQFILLVFSGIALLGLVGRFPGRQGLLYLALLLLCEYVAGYFVFKMAHRQFEYGMFLVAGVLAAPLAQLENLFVVDRAITRRLKKLERLLPLPSGLPPDAATTQDKVIIPRRLAFQSRLHWKLGSLERLENELASLYTFDNTLLQGMREVLAVYDLDGQLLFHNSSWKKFCEQQDFKTTATLEDIAPALGLRDDLSRLSPESGAWLEKELFLKETSWRFRVLRLPWPSAAEPNAVMFLGEDISARRERDQARAEAIGFVTHELRTPLIAIQGFGELMMRYPQQIATSEAATTIFRESRRLVAMINAYLEVLRMDVGSRPLRVKPVDVAAMVHHVEQILQPLAQSAQIKIDADADPKVKTLDCDEPLVTGALLNLLSNAVKYSPSGSMVTLRVAMSNDHVEFQVHNRGPVIPQESLAHVFEPYYRAPDQPGEKAGWGLGLAFVKRIAEQHGGRARVSSDPLSGTCFRLAFPLHAKLVSEATA